MRTDRFESILNSLVISKCYEVKDEYFNSLNSNNLLAWI